MDQLLDLRGPEFLLFYAVFAGVVLGLQFLAQRLAESTGPPPPRLTDPIRIAYLRGGAWEAFRVAAMGLLDRGLLRAVAGELVAEPGGDASGLGHLERALRDHFRAPRAFRSLIGCDLLAHDERLRLEEMNLLPDQRLRDRRRGIAIVAVAVLGVVAFMKVMTALQRGHSNVLFLVALAALAIFAVHRLSLLRLTRRGREALADLATLFAGVKERAGTIQRGRWSRDVIYTAAVFGLGSSELLPARPAEASIWRSGSGESDVGYTCGSTCGGGGGGDGGGGSGCGGCGS